MGKLFLYSVLILILCSSCVSRTTNREVGLSSGQPGRTVPEKKLIWIWDKEFRNP